MCLSLLHSIWFSISTHIKFINFDSWIPFNFHFTSSSPLCGFPTLSLCTWWTFISYWSNVFTFPPPCKCPVPQTSHYVLVWPGRIRDTISTDQEREREITMDQIQWILLLASCMCSNQVLNSIRSSWVCAWLFYSTSSTMWTFPIATRPKQTPQSRDNTVHIQLPLEGTARPLPLVPVFTTIFNSNSTGLISTLKNSGPEKSY